MEAIALMCDVCGKPAVETVTIKVGNKNHVKDLCSQHLGELLQNARTPKRGRPRVVASGTRRSTPASNGRRKRPAAVKTTAKTTRKPRAAKTAKVAARRGRPRKRQSAT